VAIDIVRVHPSRLNTLASQAAQTLTSPASQVSRSKNRKTGVQLKRIIWGLPRSARNPNPATPGGEIAVWLLVPIVILVNAVAEHFSISWYYEGMAILLVVLVLGSWTRRAMRRKLQ
jgi:hypothetical protein